MAALERRFFLLGSVAVLTIGARSMPAFAPARR